MPQAADKASVFNTLKPLLGRHAGHLAVVTNSADDYYLNTHHVMRNDKPLFFGAVQIKKNYVSYHLMPVYVNPKLLDSSSEALRKRMHGKSCFNFRCVDSTLISELTRLTDAGFEFYVEQGYIKPG